MTGIAVVGCGRWGRNYLSILQTMPRVDLVGVSDTDPSVLADLSRAFPRLTLYRSLEDCLEDSAVEALVVATPPETHYQIARAAVLKGRHILVEKPFTLKHEDSEELLRLARECKVTVMAGHLLEYHTSTWMAKGVLEASPSQLRVGSIRCGERPAGGGVSVLWDLLVHDLARLRFLLEPCVEAVRAVGHHDSWVMASLQLGSGGCASLHASWSEYTATRRMDICEPGFILSIDDLPPESRVTLARRCGDATVISATPALGNALFRQCEHFVKSIVSGSEPLTGPKDIRWVMTAMCCAEESLARNGQWVSWSGQV